MVQVVSPIGTIRFIRMKQIVSPIEMGCLILLKQPIQ